MKRSEAIFGLLRIPMDSLGVLAALLLSYRLREANVDLVPNVQLLKEAETLPPIDIFIDSFVLPGLFLFLVIAAFLGLYKLKVTGSAWNELGKIILAALVWVVGVMCWYFLIEKQLFYSRILLLHSTLFIAFFVSLSRTCIVVMQRGFARWGYGRYQVFSIGEKAIAPSAKQVIEEDLRYAYQGHTKSLESLQKKLETEHADLIIQTDPNPHGRETMELIEYCRSHHIGYAFLPPVFADVPHQLRVGYLGVVPMLQFQPTPLDGWGRIFKRMFDFVVSGVLIIVLLPVYILISICILIESGFPILYISNRVGESKGDLIPVLKFRSMIKDADTKKKDLLKGNLRNDGPLFKMKNDPRVTTLGKLLRRFDLDELPQLLNVFVGDLSLVGPRPHLPEEVKKYSSYERRVFAIKPGITGLAQISGRSDLKFADEVKLDLRYIEEWSLGLDLWILWRTVFVVIFRGGED